MEAARDAGCFWFEGERVNFGGLTLHPAANNNEN